MWLYDEMCQAGFTRVSVDHSVFVKQSTQGHTMVTVHVDDMAATTSNPKTLTLMVTNLWKIIDVVDMGPIKWFLGMKVTRDRLACTISLSQSAYIDTILQHFGMTDSYGGSTPLDPKVILVKSMSPAPDEERDKMKRIPYLAGVGSLMYASIATHPDIMFAMNKLSQFNSNPGLAHWTVLQHVLCYLKQTKHYTLTLGGVTRPSLIGYTNSDYAGGMDMR